jgi:hypothetical protein
MNKINSILKLILKLTPHKIYLIVIIALCVIASLLRTYSLSGESFWLSINALVFWVFGFFILLPLYVGCVVLWTFSKLIKVGFPASVFWTVAGITTIIVVAVFAGVMPAMAAGANPAIDMGTGMFVVVLGAVGCAFVFVLTFISTMTVIIYRAINKKLPTTTIRP